MVNRAAQRATHETEAESTPPRLAPIPHALTSFSLSLSSQVAQLLTILRERTVAAGVSKRDARKAETKEKVAAGFGNM